MSRSSVGSVRPPHPPSSPRDFAARLDREWARLRTRPDLLDRAAGWSIVEGTLDDLDRVLVAIGAHTRADPIAEQALRRLVLTAAHDELAARVVLQRLVPGLLGRVRRRRYLRRGPEVFDELVSGAWIAIRTYNPRRRPACVAAALLGDADAIAFHRRDRRRARREEPTALHDDWIDEREPSDLDRFDAVVRRAVDAGLPDGDLDLLRRLVHADRTNEVARDLHITPRTLRNRRDRITAHLRTFADAA